MGIIHVDKGIKNGGVVQVQKQADRVRVKRNLLKTRLEWIMDPPPPPPPPPVGVPFDPTLKARWESNMLQYGMQHSGIWRSGLGFDQKLDAQYYDAGWVYQQIGNYLSNAQLLQTAKEASDFYRDAYLIPNSYNAQGYRNFTRGFRVLGDMAPIHQLATKAAFARDSTPETIENLEYMREVSYALLSHIDDEKNGAPHRAYTDRLRVANNAHLDKLSPTVGGTNYKPFMVGLAAHAAIEAAAFWPGGQAADAALVSRINGVASRMWVEMWDDTRGAFRYNTDQTDPDANTLTYDLSLLIAPMYSWLWGKTKEATWAIRHDKIFKGGVENAWLAGSKQFNQSYRLSFLGLMWRGVIIA